MVRRLPGQAHGAPSGVRPIESPREFAAFAATGKK